MHAPECVSPMESEPTLSGGLVSGCMVCVCTDKTITTVLKYLDKPGVC